MVATVDAEDASREELGLWMAGSHEDEDHDAEKENQIPVEQS